MSINHIPDCIARIDLNSDEHLRCPHEQLKHLRQQAPFFRNEIDGAWIVTRQQDIVSLLTHPDLSPDIRMSKDCPLHAADGDSPFMQFVANNVFAKTDKEHSRLRRLTAQGFSMRVLRRLENRLAEIIEQELHRFEGRKQIDFSEEISRVLPTLVIGTLLNLPRDQWPIFTQLSEDVLINYVPMGTVEQKLAAVERFNHNTSVFSDIIEQRRHHAQEGDFLSLLLKAEDEGNAITGDEALSLIISMVMGAADTITDFVNQAMSALLRNPKQRAIALESDASLDNAILESARHHYFVRFGHNRYALRDFEYEGHQIAKGDAVRLMFDSAGRDDAVYDAPDTFDVTRCQKPNIAFGYGRHYCPGAALAKLQSRLILRTFFRRFPDATPAGDPVYDLNKNGRRYLHFPVNLA